MIMARLQLADHSVMTLSIGLADPTMKACSKSLEQATMKDTQETYSLHSDWEV